MTRHLFLLAAFLCLAGLAWSYLLVARAQERQRRMDARLASVLTRARTAPAQASVLRKAAPAASQRSAAPALAGIVGADPARAELYHVPWPLVPLLALPPAAGVVFLVKFLAGSAAWFALPVVVLFIARKYFAARHRGQTTALLGQFPDALATVVRAVRVGIPISESVRAVTAEAAEPTRREFARLADDVAIGLPLDEALRGMATRNGVPEYRFFATALSLQAQTGGAIGETLDSLADVIRKRIAARARGKALAAEARMSALVLSILPGIALAGLWVVNPVYIDVLFTTETGHTLLAAAVLLLGLGTMVMRTMITKSLT